MTEFGYAGKILKIDLSSRDITRLATADYADRFLGGRGIASKIYWDETSPGTSALSPENCLVFITGPLAGFTRFSGCRWQICGKSAEMEPEAFSYANLGGSWGAWLKYAGYDGLVITGKSDELVYILIDDDRVEIKNASHIRGLTTAVTQEILQAELGQDTKILSIGPAAENEVSFATVSADGNASGSSGFGGVMGYKKLKAIALKVRVKKIPEPADPVAVKSLADQVFRLFTNNYEDYGGHGAPSKLPLRACYGCIRGCTRTQYKTEDGRKFKFFCQATDVYRQPAMKYYGDGEKASMRATRLCDEYGLDTAVLQPLITWLGQCFETGILNDQETELPLSKFGSIEFIEELVRKISFREGFGDVLARGPLRAADYVGKGSQEFLSASLITKAGETRDYDPRLMLANALIYATEPRRAIQLLHSTSLPLKRWTNWLEGWSNAFLSTEIFRDIAERFWGSTNAADFSTYAGKALASVNIQNYGYAKESLILCDLAWPIYQVKSPDKSIGFYTLESRIVSAITGREIDEAELRTTGERIFNLQRSIFIRQGWGGRRGDSLLGFLHKQPLQGFFVSPDGNVPGSEGKVVSRKGSVVEETEFEKLKDEYYRLRDWDIETGLQTKAKLAELKLGDIATELEKLDLLK